MQKYTLIFVGKKAEKITLVLMLYNKKNSP